MPDTGETHFCDEHAVGPDNYVARQDWFKMMAKTHRQLRCDGCGLWKIWVPKENNDA